ncbi:hypothetical protein KFE25_009144 [Diacronema lutheri]|uniref:F-box domain-containing protein n=2 Tax=Diacronema lutheri TaxID=2081491 RepID=A0A8J6CK61_DIALT|nr:hypothetical protein KFE25_009144 [Diacronema lutheri]
MDVDSEGGGELKPFDMLEDGLVLAIMRSLDDPVPLYIASLVCRRFAKLCTESFIWKPLLHAELPPASRGIFSWPPCANDRWRERYKQWHTLSHLTWVHCPPALGSAQPCPRFLHRAAAVGGSMYVHGGRGAESELGDMWVIRADAVAASGAASWERVTPKSEYEPIARLSATLSAVTLSGPSHYGLLMFGGRCGERFLNDVWLFDTHDATWAMLHAHSPQPSASCKRPDGRWAHSAVTHGSTEVIVFGGSAPGRCFNDIFSLSMPTHQWVEHECVGTRPPPRSGHSVCVVQGSMYVFGGNTTKESFNDLWSYHVDTRAWTQVRTKASPSARVGHALIPFGNRLMLFGGRKFSENTFDSALHCFDLQARRWSELAVGGLQPRVRTGHAAIPCNGGFLVFGGLSSVRDEYFNDVFMLRLFG